ncbi:MAG: hypothetical protein PHH01_00305 [Patescibacteria group bacterium]|nr:hypothetical protein [Patescibacteria group bacterium]
MTLYHLIALLAAPVAGWLYASWRWPKPIWGEIGIALFVTAAGVLNHGPSLFQVLFAGALCLSLVGFWLNGRRHTLSRLTVPHS